MAEHKPKFNSAQDSFFKELLPGEFTPQKPLVKNSSNDENLDEFLNHMHNIHQTSRLRTSVAYNDYIKTEHQPRMRERIKDLQARGIIPTESEKRTRLRMVAMPTISLILKKLGLDKIVEEQGYTPDAIAKIQTEAGKLKINADVKDLKLACDYFLWLKRKHRKSVF